jgi:hypothetical protein
MVYEVETNRLIHLFTPLFFGWTISLSQLEVGLNGVMSHTPLFTPLKAGFKLALTPVRDI